MSRIETAAAAHGAPARTLALTLVLGALGLALWLPPLAEGLPLAGQRALVITLVTIVLWTTEALEPGVTALLSVTLLALTGAAPTMRAALQGFANPVPYFLIGVLTMGVAVVRSGLAERLAHAILERAGGRRLAVYVQLVLAFPVLTFVLPSATTRSGILIHIYDEVFTLAAVPRGADVAKAVMLALSSINRLASTALLTGGITPVMSAGIIGGMSWTGWFALMAVPYYTILVLGGALTWALYRRGLARGLPALERLRRRPLSGAEWRTIAVILGASALWLTDAWHHLDPALPALLAFVALLTPRLGPLVWADLERGVGWANVFVIAASISLAHVLGASGAAAWLARSLVGGLPALGGGAPRGGGDGVTGPGAQHLRISGSGAANRDVGRTRGWSEPARVRPGGHDHRRRGGLLPCPEHLRAGHLRAGGHVSAGEVLKFGLWMTLVAWVAIVLVALPWWATVGEPLRPR